MVVKRNRVLNVFVKFIYLGGFLDFFFLFYEILKVYRKMVLMYVFYLDEIERLVKIEKVKQEIVVNIEELLFQFI